MLGIPIPGKPSQGLSSSILLRKVLGGVPGRINNGSVADVESTCPHLCMIWTIAVFIETGRSEVIFLKALIEEFSVSSLRLFWHGWF
jgi:hypothetical protein